MTSAQIKAKVLSYKDWEFWVERPFAAFIMSLFAHGGRREYMKQAGMNVEWPVTLFQNGQYFRSETTWNNFAAQLEKEIKAGRSVLEVSKSCEKYWERSKKQIKAINKSKASPLEKLERLYPILALDISYIWLTHGLEHLYNKKLHKEIPKYYKGDVDKFIGDAGYPIKKNAHHFLEAALRGKKPIAQVQKEFGWIKVRDGFSDPFSIAELAKERKRMRTAKKEVEFKRPNVPAPLRPLIKIAQELVYLRTLRTDALYNLMYLARPTLTEVGKYYGIEYKKLIDYSALDLIDKKPRVYPRLVTFISFGKDYALLDKPIYKDTLKSVKELKGTAANYGTARGTAKIVKTAYEIDKVKKGDILFAPTTAPSYIIGMKKAAAFVTDEGGITSHAAIVSREMGKPCIIGTKIGTKIFKDGDLVEVDANKGTVRKINK
jgi:phosphohistidine swiveling domain-containing protein